MRGSGGTRRRGVGDADRVGRADDLAQRAPVPLWTAGPDGRRTWFNGRWLELTGRELDAEQGDGWRDRVHPDDAPRSLATCRDAISRGEPFAVEYRLLGTDGEYRLLRDHGTPRRDVDGTLLGYVGACEDITEQRLAVDALRWRERKLTILADVGRLALESEDDQRLRDLVVARVAEGLDVPLVAVLEHRDDELAMVAGVGWDPEPAGARRRFARGSGSLAGYTLAVDRPVVTEDLAAETRFVGDESLRGHGVVSAVNVVIRAPGTRVGLLGAYATSPRRFSDDDVAFLRNVANVMAAALARAAVERELRERELAARLAFSAGHMGTWRWDVATDRVWWSQEMESVYGLEPGTFGGTFESYVAAIHPDDRDRVARSVAAARTEGGELSVQHRVVRADGTIRQVEGRGRPIRDDDGTVTQWIGVGIDVTEQAEVATELRERALETRLAFAAGRMGSWRWNSRTNRGTWSPELETLIGLEPRTFDGSWDAFIRPILAADGPMMREAVGKAVAASCEFAVQYRVRRTDGRLRWVETRGAPIGDGTEWIGVTIDVSEVRTALEAVSASRGELEETIARLDSLLEHAPVGFAFFDRELRFVRVNAPLAEMNGLSVEAHLGHTVAELLPGVWPSVGPVLERVLATGEPAAAVEVSGQTPAHPGVEEYWIASYYPVPGADGEPLGVGAVAVNISERKRREREARLTALASELLAADVDAGTTLDRAAALMVPELADSCVVTLVPRPGMARRVAVAHVDPDLARRMERIERRWPLDIEAILEREQGEDASSALLVAEVTGEMRGMYARHQEQRDLAHDHGAQSVIIAPLRVGTELIGALCLAVTGASGRRFLAADVPFVEELAARLAFAVQSSHRADEARRAQARLDVLAEISELLTVNLDSNVRLSSFVETVVPTFADVCSIYLAERGRLRLAAFFAADPEVRRMVEEFGPWPEREITDDSPPSRVFTTAEPALMPEVSDRLVEERLPDADSQRVARIVGIRSLLCVPLVGADGPLGVLAFGFSTSGRRYTEHDLPLAGEVARRVAPALENALRFERQTATAEALQRSLLPQRLPELGATRLAARYVPSGEGARIGGDWYDAIPLPDGRVVLAIGDVVGHGVRAAAAMGRLRNVLQFCALDGLHPAETLERLNAYFSALADADMATVLVADLDPATGTLRYANAGHPPALLAGPDGVSRFLDETRGMPLCATDTARYSTAETVMAPGSLLVLYTDGLVERRGESIDDGMARLLAGVQRLPDDVDLLADGLVAELLDDERSTDDDVALLLLRTLAPGDRLDLRLDAAPRELSRLRRLLGEWLVRCDADPAEIAELTISVNEVAANAIEHAYGLVDAEFLLAGTEHDGLVEIEVRDFGRWRRRTPQGERGRGLQLAAALVDDVEIERGPTGTTVRLRRRLGAGSPPRPEEGSARP